jgi:hypothetical protein
MRKTLLPLIILGVSLTAAHAQIRDSLPDLVSAFVTAERPDADAARHEAISACILGAFEGLSDEELDAFVVVDDFEESFDNLVKVYPEREEIIEECEDL